MNGHNMDDAMRFWWVVAAVCAVGFFVCAVGWVWAATGMRF